MENKSVGQRFADSDVYQQVQATKQLPSAEYKVGSFHETKALSTDAASAGDVIVPTRVPGIVSLPERRLTIRDLIPAQNAPTGIVEYVEETGFTDNAATVAEGALKPLSDATYDLIEAKARVVAHGVVASRQVLSDAPSLQAHIDGKLIYGIKLEEERQLLYGDGLGENLQGLLTHASRQTLTWSTTPSGTTKLDAIRRAATLVTLALYSASGVVVHPTDKEEIDLSKGSDDHYILVDAGAGVAPAYFRLPVVETPAITAGEAAVGAFNLAARIHDVWQATVRLYEQHADYALRNQVLILGEERIALANERPEAVVHVDYDAAPA